MKIKNIKSFIEPRPKSSFNIRDLILLSFILLMISFIIYLVLKPSNNIKLTTKKEEYKKEISKTDNFSKLLPNHKEINLKKQKELTNILSVIPYDMVLTTVIISDGNSTIEGEIIYKDSYYKEIKPKLLKLYEFSTATMYKTSEGTYSITIRNKKLRKINIPQQFHPKYKIVKEQSINELKTILKLLLPTNSIIRFAKEEKRKFFTKVTFRVSTYIHSPKELYDIIEKINNKPACIVLEDRMELNTYNSMIRINFEISIYQAKKDIKE